MRGFILALSLGVAAVCACSSTAGNNTPGGNGNCMNIAGSWSLTGGNCDNGDTCTVTQDGCSATFSCASGTHSSTGTVTSTGWSFSGTTGNGQSISCSGTASGGSFQGSCNAGGQSCTASGTVSSGPGPVNDAGTDSGNPGSDSGQPTGDSGVCTATSSACTSDSQCCSWQQNHGYCVNYGSETLCADSCTVNSDCVSGCCATTQQGHNVCAPSSTCNPTNESLGAPCTSNSQCASGTCANGGGTGLGWCTMTCTNDSQCPNSPYLMFCMQNSGGADVCFTECTSNSDCTSKYGSSSYCQAATSVGGISVSVCVN